MTTDNTSAGLLAGELEKLAVYTEIKDVDTGEEGRKEVRVSIDLRDRITAAIRQSAAPASEAGEKSTATRQAEEAAARAARKVAADAWPGSQAWNDALAVASQIATLSRPSESAETVELLREAREALEPFARNIDYINYLEAEDGDFIDRPPFAAGDFRRAAAALAKLDAQGGAGE